MKREELERRLGKLDPSKVGKLGPRLSINRTPPLANLDVSQLPRVAVTRDNPSEQDTLVTQVYLELYQTKDGWECPRCNAVFSDAEKFLNHLSDEINQAFGRLASRPK